MPVTDPNYENFSYQNLLDRAVSPINRLGDGQLAIAQQNNQRNFDLLAQQRASDLAQQRESFRMGAEQRNRISELQTAEQLREKGNQAELDRQAKQQADQAVAGIQQTHPEFTRKPGESDAAVLARAQDVGHQDIYKNLTDAVDKGATLKGQLSGQIDEVGKAIPTDYNAIGKAVSIDPIFQTSGNQLDPAIIKGLRDGTLRDKDGKPMDVTDVIADLRSGRLSGKIQGWVTGTNPNDLANTLAQKVQDLNAQQQAANQQRVIYKLNSTEKAMGDRLTANNELQNNIIKSLPSSYQAKAFSYINQSGTPANAPTASVNGRGLVNNLAGANPPPPPGASSSTPPAPVTDQGNSALPPEMKNPIIAGLVSHAVPDYLDQSPTGILDLARKNYQDTAESAKQQLDALGATIGANGKAVINPTAQFPSPLSLSGDFPPPLSMTTERRLSPAEISKKEKAANALIEHWKFATQAKATLDGKLPMYGGQVGGGSPPLPADPAPAAIPPINFQQPAPANVGQPTETNSPAAQAPLGQQGTGASKGQIDPSQMFAAQSLLKQRLGTSDPTILNEVKSRAQQMGLDVQALAHGVVQGDPHAIATSKGIIAQIQGGNQGQLPITPDLSSGFGTPPASDPTDFGSPPMTSFAQ